MITFAIALDEGAYPNPMALIRAGLEERFGRVEITEIPLPSVAADPTVREIARSVAFEMGLKFEHIIGDNRQPRFARARFAVCWVANMVAGRGPAAIGRALGYRDHSTASYGIGRGAELREQDPAFRMVTDRIAAAINAGRA